MRKTYFSPQVNLTQRLSRHVARILKTTFEECDVLQRLATNDHLTGILNRREFENRYEEKIAAALRFKLPITVAMIDVDRFKRINDTLGHQVGDMVLKKLAEVMRGSLRKNDIVSRYGGDEFAVILDGTPFEHATVPLERIRSRVEQLKVKVRSKEIRLTVSVGYSSFTPESAPKVFLPEEAQQALRQQLIEAADNALYTAKRTGRNRVCS
jgi:diguanylate cyclase (GGDEF)-like protein